jgi:hypothetical protein
MYKEENLTPAEKALESALGQLKPISNTINRDVFMFNAGRASVGRKRPWQILSGALTILLLCSIIIRLGTNGVQSLPSDSEQIQFEIARLQYKPVQTDSSDLFDYTMLRDNILANGLEALPFESGIRDTEPIMNRKQLLENMLSL